MTRPPGVSNRQALAQPSRTEILMESCDSLIWAIWTCEPPKHGCEKFSLNGITANPFMNTT